MLTRLPCPTLPARGCAQGLAFPLFPERSSCNKRASSRRGTARTRGRLGPPAALFGDLLQRLDPASQADGSPDRERRAVLARRALLRTLEGCRQEGELRLPSAEETLPPYLAGSGLQSVEQQEAIVSAALHADPSCAASNAVPFSPASTISEGQQKEGGGSSVPFGAAAQRAEAVRTILPCVFAAEGKLDLRGIEHMASQLALRQMQQLDFARFRDGQARCLPDNVRWCGPTPFPSARVAAAATLHRMVTRLGSLTTPLPQVAGSVIVMTYSPQERQLVAQSFALYLYLYCRLDLEEAAKEAQLSLRAPVQPSSLLPCLEELALATEGWQRRVKLVWPYGGGRVELSGEAVGGWERKVPMSFDVRKRLWSLWLWGLPPGTYRCKFIVDSRWCTDMAAPTELDSRGNANNVITVLDVPPLATAPRGDKLGEAAASGEGGGSGSSSSSLSEESSGKEDGDELQMGVVTPAAGVDEGLGPAAAEAPPSDGEWGAEVAVPLELQLLPHEGDVVRFGAMLLAFYTKLSVQRRVPVYH